MQQGDPSEVHPAKTPTPRGGHCTAAAQGLGRKPTTSEPGSCGGQPPRAGPVARDPGGDSVPAARTCDGSWSSPWPVGRDAGNDAEGPPRYGPTGQGSGALASSGAVAAGTRARGRNTPSWGGRGGGTGAAARVNVVLLFVRPAALHGGDGGKRTGQMRRGASVEDTTGEPSVTPDGPR